MRNISNAASEGETELLIKCAPTRSKKEESRRKSLKKEKEADFCEKETMTPPPPGGGMLITMPPTMPLPKMILGKSSEQERTEMGKRIESIDETPEITQEEEEDDEAKQGELKKEAKATLGNGAKKNLTHFSFTKEDMEFKPPKKPCASKGGEKPTTLTFLPVFLN